MNIKEFFENYNNPTDNYSDNASIEELYELLDELEEIYDENDQFDSLILIDVINDILDNEILSETTIENIFNFLSDIYVEILDDEDDLDEGVPAKRTKIDRQAKRKRRIEYRKNKQKIKLKSKRYRKTQAYKRYKKKMKKYGKQNKTSTGKRKKKFYN